MQNVIALDLGATNIAAARVGPEGQILARGHRPAEVERGGRQIIEKMAALVSELRDERTRAVGVGSPGIIEPQTGISRSAAVNIPDWDGMDIKGRIEAATALPVFVENDANAAALGEAWIGQGAGESVVVLLTLGTGIGGGVVIGGKVYQGKSNRVAELGHLSVDFRGRKCMCGNVGCIEAYASAGAVGRRARELLAGRPEGAMLRAAGGRLEAVTAKIVCEAAAAGDALAGEVMDEACAALGAGIGNIINAFNPSVVVLAGGMAQAGEVLTGRLEKELASGRAYPPILADCRLALSTLGTDAGLIGQAKLAWDGVGEA